MPKTKGQLSVAEEGVYNLSFPIPKALRDRLQAKGTRLGLKGKGRGKGASPLSAAGEAAIRHWVEDERAPAADSPFIALAREFEAKAGDSRVKLASQMLRSLLDEGDRTPKKRSLSVKSTA